MANYDLSYTGANVNSTLAAVGGKADKVSSATNGHFAGLDSSGNLTDSGKAASDFATASSVTTIEGKIPTQASSSNQLADKEFVNSSISTATATFKGTYNLVSDLSLTTSATTSDIASALASASASARQSSCQSREDSHSDSKSTSFISSSVFF